MRIVGGKFKGRSLSAPTGRDTRPTTDRVREAIFNRLEHGVDGFEIVDSRVLDLFAGTGALGLEALSRGGRFAHFVDNSDTARGIIRANADALGVIGQCKLWRRDATRLGPCPPLKPYSLVFLDPPYEQGLAERALLSLVTGGWLEDNAIIIVEEAAKADIGLPDQLQVLKEHRYGDTRVLVLRYCGADA